MKAEKQLEICRSLREEIGMKFFVLARPDRLRDNAETATSCRGPGPTRKKKEIYHYPGGRASRCIDAP